MHQSGKTSFQDVRDEVIHRIQSGIWPQGTLLPTEVELAEEFGCARATVNRALRELAENGVVDRKRKSGTRVNTAPVKQAKIEIAIVRHSVEEQNAIYRYALVHKEITAIPPWLAAQLDLPITHKVMYLKCMHYADNRPYQFEERWVNIDAVPTILDADLVETGPNEWLLSVVPFTDAQINFCAVGADADLSEFLSTPTGTPVFQLERTTWLQNKPVTFVRMTYHPGYRMSTSY
ncbi:GntR family transcriptional regulator [Cochlodiniinecator piscidefendens]|uniref:GntR family transcriptional regulator n=1 Tax=Cochlodiniinecator piscidefendens TaxID=2715756 RepID=UPI00140C61A0